MKVERASAIPLYRQLASALRHDIESGKLKPGATLLPESELTKKYNISRITVRQALRLMVSEGLVVRKQGKGTYVCPPQVRQNLNSLQGFAELMAARGVEQAMQVIALEKVAAEPCVAQALGLDPGQPVMRIRRRHVLKGSPIAYAVIYLPEPVGARFTAAQVSTTPIYTLLSQFAHIEIKHARQTIRALVADRETSRLLAITRGAPVMRVERVTYSTEEQPVEYIIFHYRGDAYELAVELNRDPAQNILRPIHGGQWQAAEP